MSWILARMPNRKFLVRGFRRPVDVMASSLGPLERDVMDELWRRDEMSVRDVL